MAISYVNSNSNGASSGTAVTVTKPTGIQSGDVIIAVVNARGNTSISDNNGSNAFASVYQTTFMSSSAKYHIFRRIATGSEPASYAFTLAASVAWEVIVSVYRGVDSSVFRITPSSSTHSSSFNVAPTAPAISSGLVAGDMLIAVGLMNYTYAIKTNPSGWNVRQDLSGYQTSALVDLVATGTSKSAAAWALNSSSYWAANMFALKPAALTGNSLFFGMNF